MGEQNKSREQLINELNALRRRHRQVENGLQCEILKLLAICDSINEAIYVSDPVTYEILFANKTLRELHQKELAGRICYQEFQGLEAPCEFCTNNIIFKDKGKPYKWEHYNRQFRRHYLIEDQAIKWPDGRDVRFEFAVDITEHKKVEEAIRRRLEFMDTVKRISSRFIGISNIDAAINESLADIGLVSGASRAYLFHISQDETTMSNTHEWCAAGVLPQIEKLQNIPNKIMHRWIDKLYKREAIHITDVSQLPDEAQAEKELLAGQDIKSLLALPLYIRGKLSGFIGFDNVAGTGAWHDSDLALLNVCSDIIGNAYERKLADEALRESAGKYRAIFENTGTAIAIIEADMTLSLVNSKFENYTGYKKEEIQGRKRWTDIFKDYLEEVKEAHFNAPPQNFESQLVDLKGNTKDVIVTVTQLPGTNKLVASLLDITERKRMEKQLKYLSFHDGLTGLYNRAFFEEEMRRLGDKRHLPIGIIMCDVDGLKLVNDTLGHQTGDELLIAASRIIKKCFRESDIIARIGGDEFAVILPRSDRNVVERACRNIRDVLAQYNSENTKYIINLSIGFAVKEKSCGSSMAELFKEADNNMYREKLHHKESVRSALVQVLMRALEARDFITEGHAERLQRLIARMAVDIGIPEQSTADLRLLAQFHDIGKVGVPDRILFKPGPLTPEERKEVEQHCAIGHRIALAAPDLAPIADWILKHHEWWNGNGYPLGLKEEEIPLECRILAIADAYDAMTNDRPYRKAITHEAAVNELKKCAGTQFDPFLTPKFIEILDYIKSMS